MSSGGSNYSTGTTGSGPMTARIESPISKGPNSPQGGMSVPVDSFSSPASGGKGGFPSAQSPYAQQQPQVYMPPQQPSYYQQAFPQQYSYTQSSFYAPQQQYQPQQYGYTRQLGLNPERISPLRELRAGPDGFMPGQLRSDSWGRKPSDYQISEIPYRGGPGLTPVEATQGVVSEPNYSGGLGSLMRDI